MPRKKSHEGLLCKINGCWNPVRTKGWCNAHYLQFYKSDPTYKPIDNQRGQNTRSHPFYHLWFERKAFNELCEEWLNFWKFVDDISPKPQGNYFLVRLRNELFGPTNFKWQEHLKKKKDESNKDWWARKRAARILANPSLESDRNIIRTFGINRNEYNEILKFQNYGCGICGKTETSVDGKTGTIKKLAIDHCHNSKKIRGLLCWRCNTTIGKVNDDIELLQKMIDYLNKHKGEQ